MCTTRLVCFFFDNTKKFPQTRIPAAIAAGTEQVASAVSHPASRKIRRWHLAHPPVYKRSAPSHRRLLLLRASHLSCARRDRAGGGVAANTPAPSGARGTAKI